MTLYVLLLLCLSAQPQEPAARLENTGKPMRIGFQCTEEDIRTLGLTCPAQQPCPVYLELSALESVGNKIFVTGNIHTESATLSSVLLASDDTGKTWYEPHERICGAALEQIQFVDFEAGWVGGQHLQPVPRDPFLLLTTDGGKSWRARPVYGESRAGTIQRFWFDSRTTGTIWIDRTQAGEAASRHEMYESRTGGESWMVRQVSDRPIPDDPKRTRPPNPDWRIRADATSRSYRIEKHLEARWQTVAAFLIPIGECKQPEAALPPEPVTPQTPPAVEPEPPKPPRKPPTLKKP